ncbi:ABC transporter ATP-binding protein [Bryobacter aggregatus]|uniref:ABC transporter ATP-binding protein n=1 Tax=Bryobacter aggregatus TaxID=360054 RepID=UPI00068CBE86|nr:ABC transporter ATP-binding protein [Bryobacter aggregatus]
MTQQEAAQATFKDTRQQWATRLQAVRNLPPVLFMVWEAGKTLCIASVLARTVSALIPIAMLGVSRWIIDAISAASHGAPVPDAFWWWVGAEFGLACLAAITGRSSGYFESLLADRFTRYLSVRVMEHASKLDLVAYENSEFYDRLERARSQATDRVRLVRVAGDIVQQAIHATSFCLSVAYYSPILLLLLVLCILPAFTGESHFAFLGYSLNFRQTRARREIDYLRMLGASKESAKELKLFGLAALFTTRFERLSNMIYRQNRILARKRMIAGGLLALVSAGGYYSAYVWVMWQALERNITVGTMVFLAGAIAGASNNLQGLFATFSGAADEALFLTDLILFFEEKPQIQAPPRPKRFPKPIRKGFSFENVSYRYPGSDRLILNGINFHLAPGERVALVGENGQGKTTIVKLLARLYDPTEGRILLDGVDLREYDPADITRNIAVIFQDFMKYDMTVRENIAMGQVNHRGSLEDEPRILQAAEQSLALPVIDKLEGRLNQMLGRRFEAGVDLSGGEWQKIALARAYLRDSQVLVMDEPTAALDARSELEVFERLANLSAGRMALLISHRFSTVRMADRILVLADGQVAEEGSHESLVAAGGQYHQLFQLQAASYQ